MSSGFLNVVKPPGMTSHDIVDLARKWLPRKTKVGHLGTLDPAAAGVLPLAVGSATRLIPLLPDLGDQMKAYLGHIKLGVRTTTDDLEGDVLEEADWSHVTEAAIEAELAAFRGSIRQVPPQVSAIRKEGVRAYEAVREGKTVELEARPVEVAKLELLSFEPEQGIAKVHLVCGSGTYVRSIARDLGARLGICGSLKFLLRLSSGPFQLQDAWAVEELMGGRWQERLIPLSYPFRHLPEAEIAVRLQQKGQIVEGEFPSVELCRVSDGLLRPLADRPNCAVVEALFEGAAL